MRAMDVLRDYCCLRGLILGGTYAVPVVISLTSGLVAGGLVASRRSFAPSPVDGGQLQGLLYPINTQLWAGEDMQLGIRTEMVEHASEVPAS